MIQTTDRSAPEGIDAAIARVTALKRERDAFLLCHNYQAQEVKRVADAIGDSFQLSARARTVPAKWIVFCGVRFMAETAKLLNPSKRVILPESKAGCDLADSIGPEGLRALKTQHPRARVVMYINSNVEVKALSDAICTSSNALKVVEAMDSEEVIFGPDRNLAAHVAKQTSKRVIPWAGSCPIHEVFTLPMLQRARKNVPDACVIVHPECPSDVQEEADEVLSTSQMIETVGRMKARRFLIGTEIGLIEQLRELHPDREFWPVYEHKSCDEACACPHMKITGLHSVLRALDTGKEAITIPEAHRAGALRAVERMLEIGK
ncbi:MAG: quinolinate synthase NadA [Planctomycetes bacterium]|nr:quinolinate synthase NadA [Planctomycetota bacterium]